VNPDIVMIGDSITHMWGGLPKERKHVRGADSWNALFGNRGLNIGFGWDRTQNVIWRIDHGELDGITPKHVVITIGTNNLAGTGNHQAGTPEEIVAGIRTIILRVKNKLPETNIVLMAVLPRGEKPDDPNRKKINKINAGLPALAKELNAQFIDLGPKLLDANGILSRKMAGDFLHPTAAGYQIWADTLRPIVSEAVIQE
jgi:lysophospholipase L1-like esterase